jgi:signal transduction histidine kinase
MVAAWTPLGTQIDNDAYDWILRAHGRSASPAQSVIVAFDDETLNAIGGMRNLRTALAGGLEIISRAQPAAVAVDIVLANHDTPGGDAYLARTLSRTPNLVLPCDLTTAGWQDPIPSFRTQAEALGHVHADPDRHDGVTRQILLYKTSGRDRRWALAFEAFRLARGAEILESPGEFEVGGLAVPAGREPGAPLLLAYAWEPIPLVSFKQLRDEPERAAMMKDRVVFVGVTSRSAAQDRLMTPYGIMTGVEIHAQLYETLAAGHFRQAPAETIVAAVAAITVVAAGVIFAYTSGWVAYGLGALVLAAVHILPFPMFTRGVAFPYFASAAAAWLSIAMAASYQHFVVRRRLQRTEIEKARYQQAIHFVTHEMRTPLTAIQGSSELIGRYNLDDAKRKQVALTINSESKRLARMVQTFLDVERLTAGQLELKRETFSALDLLTVCLARVQPLAARKQIELVTAQIEPTMIAGDRELMEYAVYNLLTNAVKYSPDKTTVTVRAVAEAGLLRLSIADQGIGMDEHEVRNVFRKFYRTKQAEKSGEVGTGIGLSIVEQIVAHHGGRVEVSSRPGAGSVFTIVVPVAVTAGIG